MSVRISLFFLQWYRLTGIIDVPASVRRLTRLKPLLIGLIHLPYRYIPNMIHLHSYLVLHSGYLIGHITTTCQPFSFLRENVDRHYFSIFLWFRSMAWTENGICTL